MPFYRLTSVDSEPRWEGTPPRRARRASRRARSGGATTRPGPPSRSVPRTPPRNDPPRTEAELRASAEARRRREAPLKRTVAALRHLWGSDGSLRFDANRDAASGTLSTHELARRLADWIDDTLKELADGTAPIHRRFRRAWEVAPAICVDQPIDTTAVDTVGDVLRADRRQLDRLVLGRARSHVNAATHEQVERLARKYSAPDPPRDQWAYVVEAIRIAAVELPNYLRSIATEGLAESAEVGDSVPFVAVVLDAMCPGYAASLDHGAVDDAVRAWAERGDVPPSETIMKVVEAVLRRQPFQRRRAAFMARQWPRVGPRVRIDWPTFATEWWVGPRSRDVFSATPPSVTETSPTSIVEIVKWASPIVAAVREAMPSRALVRSRVGVVAGHARGEALPKDFMQAAAELLREPARTGAGRRPVSDEKIIASILARLQTRRPWESLPYGRTASRRYAEMKRDGRDRAFDLLAARYGLLRSD